MSVLTSLSASEAYTLDKMNSKSYSVSLGTRIKQLEDGQNVDVATSVGAVNAPTSGTTAVVIERYGKLVSLTFTLTAARIPVTDAGGSGSYGSLKLFDFVEQAVAFLGCRQNYTAYAEGVLLDTAAGDAVFAIGVGTTAISAAADGVLAAANRNVGGSIAQTLSAGTTTGTLIDNIAGSKDGTATAADLCLNWSGTAATVDATDYIDVTGTISVVLVLLGDD